MKKVKLNDGGESVQDTQTIKRKRVDRNPEEQTLKHKSVEQNPDV